jgi:hypothetical protein
MSAEANLKRILLDVLPKDLLLNLYEMAEARALRAFELIRDGTTLDRKRAKEAVGQVRFRMQEQGFQDVCEQGGGTALFGGLIPGSDMRVFQPFMRFQGAHNGVILGLATMPEPRKIPVKNQSRSAGVTLNYELSPRLDLDGSDPKIGDIFVLFLIARDPLHAGRIEEVALGIVNSAYTDFIFYEPIDEFMRGYAEPEIADVSDLPPPTITLRNVAKPFVPPEKQDDADDARDDTA